LSRNARFIALKDARWLLKGKEALLWTFVMPIVFFFFFGKVTSGFGGGGDGGGGSVLAVHVPGDAGFLADRLVRVLGENGFDVRRVADEEELSRFDRRLSVPAGFTAGVLTGVGQTLRMVRPASDLGGELDRVRATRALYTLLADVMACAGQERRPSPDELERLDAMPRTVTLDVAPAGGRVRIPTGFEQAVPGIMVMFTLIVSLTGGAVTLVIERNEGLLRRLASTPITRGEIVQGKWAGRLGLAYVQIGFAMVAGTVLFQMDWGPDLPVVLLVLLAWGGLCASLALLLSTIARTEGQTIGIGVLAANVLAALGGCWWPIEITPDWMQSLAWALPTGWAMDALHHLVSYRSGPAAVLPHVGLMAAVTLVLGFWAARRFRFQ